MALYTDLRPIIENGEFNTRMEVAVCVAANTIKAEAPETPLHDQRAKWAGKAITNPILEAKRMTWAIIAEYKDLAVSEILQADDIALQTAVNDAVNLFAVLEA